jgi:hypothetical protein
MEEKFTFSSAGEIQKVEFALARSGYTHADVEWLTSGNILRDVREVRRGNAEAKQSEFFRYTGEATIQIPAQPRPTLKQLQKAFDWIKSVERDTSPTEAVTMKLATVLPIGDTKSISGSEYEKRIAGKQNIFLGYQQAVWLVEHQDEFPEFMKLLGKIYIDFSGLIVVSADGDRHIPCLYQDGQRWYLDWDWLGDSFFSGGRLAASSE